MLLLTNGTIFRGTAALPESGSVLIDGDRITAVGDVTVPAECEVLDCAGLAVAPGFIDLHSHSDLQVLEDRMEKVKQGVTTEVVGNCGFSPFPHGGDPAPLWEFGGGIFCRPEGWGWETARAYLDEVERHASRLHVAPLVGHGSLRIAVAGLRQGPLGAAGLDRMAGILADSLAAGCAGFSTGLMYAPGSSAGREELETLCRVVAQHGKLYATHMRSYGEALVESTREQIALARASGCRLQISHLQAAGRANWDLQERALEEIEAARADGIDVEFDIYPYQCGSTVLTQVLPQWALDGGVAALMQRLGNPAERERIAAEIRLAKAPLLSDVTISAVGSAENGGLVGLTVDRIAADRGVEPVYAVLDLLEEERAAVNMISFNQSEENLRQLLRHPLCSIITDGFYVKGKPHPRLHGTFPELLGTMVRERGWLTLADAVRKVTAKPAARLGLTDRGRLEAGCRADITVFDPARVASRSTYEAPEADPLGIVRVIKDGQTVFAA